MNATWHRRNPMPPNPSLDQRVRGHKAHARACGCRPIPTTVARILHGPRGSTGHRRWGLVGAERFARLIKIDRAIYAVDDRSRSYQFLRRNLRWQRLDPRENERNKRRISGYRRVFRDGRTKTYRPNRKGRQ